MLLRKGEIGIKNNILVSDDFSLSKVAMQGQSSEKRTQIYERKSETPSQIGSEAKNSVPKEQKEEQAHNARLSDVFQAYVDE